MTDSILAALSPERITWAIDARARSQRLMLALFEFGRRTGYEQGAGSDAPDLDSAVFGFLVGISFSLWRAAFLADLPTRTWPAALADAQALLASVLKTNTVLFGTEQTLQGWTAGYYLNNAKLRLGEVVGRQVQANRASAAELEDVNKISLIGTDPKDSWTELCDSAERVFARLNKSR